MCRATRRNGPRTRWRATRFQSAADTLRCKSTATTCQASGSTCPTTRRCCSPDSASRTRARATHLRAASSRSGPRSRISPTSTTARWASTTLRSTAWRRSTPGCRAGTRRTSTTAFECDTTRNEADVLFLESSQFRRCAGEEGTGMILGMTTFTAVHVLLSLIGILSGLMVLLGLLTANPMNGLTLLFLATTVATSVTGFFFPFHGFTPALGVGILSLLILVATIAARYGFNLAGAWRWIYVIGAVAALYL